MLLTHLAFWYLPDPSFARCLGGFGPKLDPSSKNSPPDPHSHPDDARSSPASDGAVTPDDLDVNQLEEPGHFGLNTPCEVHGQDALISRPTRTGCKPRRRACRAGRPATANTAVSTPASFAPMSSLPAAAGHVSGKEPEIRGAPAVIGIRRRMSRHLGVGNARARRDRVVDRLATGR